MAQPLNFKTGAEQREQTSEQNHPAFDGQKNVDVAIKLGKVPEDSDAEKSAAKDETELAQKQKHMFEDHVRTPKKDWDKQDPAPKRNLHHAENAERDEVGPAVTRKLVARIDCDLPELGECLPNEDERSQQLERKQKQIEAGFARRVVRFDAGDDIRPIGVSLNGTWP